jgi:hypothetical protein
MLMAETSASSEDLGRLALKTAEEIDRYQRHKTNHITLIPRLSEMLLSFVGFNATEAESTLMGDPISINMIGSAFSDVTDAPPQNIETLTEAIQRFVSRVQIQNLTPDAEILSQLRDICLSISNEVVKARYGYDADERPENTYEQRAT